MKTLHFLTIALLVTTGNAFAMHARNPNIPEGQEEEILRPVRIQRWNPHRNLERQILATFDKENGTVVDLHSAYNHFNAWLQLFTSNQAPQNLKTELANLKNTYAIFAKALSRDTTQQTNLEQLRQNIGNIERLVNGTAAAVAPTNNNNMEVI